MCAVESFTDIEESPSPSSEVIYLKQVGSGWVGGGGWLNQMMKP